MPICLHVQPPHNSRKPLSGMQVVLACTGAAGMVLAGQATAQIRPASPKGDVLEHRVTTGDTLEQLAARYLGDHTRWTALQSHNRVQDPLRLRPGSMLEIPTRLLRAAAASVEFVQGDVRSTRSLNHLSDTEAAASPAADSQPVQKGQLLQEGDSLKVPANGFVSVRLADGSLVRVQSESDVQLRQMRRKGRAGSLQSVLDLREGGVEASVTQQAQSERERRFEIHTPAASTSVRGTQFLVLTDAQGQTAAAVDEGSVAVQSGQPSTLLKPGQGVAVSADGKLGKATKMLPAPDIASWPALAEDASWVSLPLPTMAGAVRYQIQLAEQKDAKKDLNQVVRGGIFQQSPARLTGVADGDYLVSIRAIDANGIPGARSTHSLRVKATPVPPLYESPEPDAVVGLGQRGLECTKVNQASAYRIQVAPADSDFAQPLIDANLLQDCSLPAQTLAQLPVGDYLWRAASIRTLADGKLDPGPFAPAQRMKLAEAPRSPELQLDGAAGEGSRNIRWAGEEGHRYHIVVAQDAGFAQPVVDTWLTEPQWATQDLAPGHYYLQMQVEDRNGLRSNFTPARQFQTGNWVTTGDGQTLSSGDGVRLMRQ